MLLQARHLSATLRVEDADVRILDDLDLDIVAGEVIDITGPSGSGKSTLLRALALLLPDARGELALDDRPAESMRAQEWRRHVTLLPQKPVVASGSVRDNITLPWRLKVRAEEELPVDARMRDVLDLLGLADVGLDREAHRLSVGQQARLGFARVWLTSPRVMLLDEADAALDDESAAAVSRAVRAFATESAGSVGGATAVVRVRHRGDDGVASRRLRLAAGRLEEVPR